MEKNSLSSEQGKNFKKLNKTVLKTGKINKLDTNQSFLTLFKSFFKNYRAPKALIVGSVLVLIITLFLSGLALWFSSKDKGVAKAANIADTSFQSSADLTPRDSNTGGNTIVSASAVTADILFIDPSKITFTPTESGAVKFGTSDLTLKVGGTGKDDIRFTAAGASSVCKFRLKEFGASDTDATKGFDVVNLKLASANTSGSYNTTTKTFDVPYSTTTGCDVRLPPGGQNQPKWWFESRVVRSDTQVFGTDNSYFQTYGAIGGVAVSG